MPKQEQIIQQNASSEFVELQPAAERKLRKIGGDSPVLEKTEVEKKVITSVEQVKQEGVQVSGMSEYALADMFAKTYQDSLRFTPEHKQWFKFNGVLWEPDSTNHTLHLSMLHCDSLIVKDSDKTKSRAENVRSLASADPRLVLPHDVWNTGPYLIGTPAGPVDLRTGQLLEPLPTYYINKSTSVAPDFSNPVPQRWLNFLHDTTKGDEQLIRYLRLNIFYSLTGLTTEQDLRFVYGPGGNGKSVFMNILNTLFGDYAKMAPMTTFTSTHSDQHPTDLAMLQGARLVLANETESNRTWAEARIKSLTGSDPITARYMRKDFFTYIPQFKIWIVGNYKPNLKNVDDAMRRRLHIIPFTHKPQRADPFLEKALKEELEQIFGWAIMGGEIYQQEGIVIPDVVKQETDEYFEEQNLFSQFINECCEDHRDKATMNEAFVRAKQLFNKWSIYAKDYGVDPGSLNAMSDRIEKMGYIKKRRNHGMRYYGLDLRQQHKKEDDGKAPF